MHIKIVVNITNIKSFHQSTTGCLSKNRSVEHISVVFGVPTENSIDSIIMKKLHELTEFFLNEEHKRVLKFREGVTFIWRKNKPVTEEPVLRRTCSENVLSKGEPKRLGNTSSVEGLDILSWLHKSRATVRRTVKVEKNPVKTTNKEALPVKSCLRHSQKESIAQNSKHVTFSTYALILSAASLNAVPELHELLDKYPSYINKPSSSGETALHKAASKGNLDCIKLLIERGANANVLDKQGRTPLLLAWEHEHYECHKQMLISLK